MRQSYISVDSQSQRLREVDPLLVKKRKDRQGKKSQSQKSQRESEKENNKRKEKKKRKGVRPGYEILVADDPCGLDALRPFFSVVTVYLYLYCVSKGTRVESSRRRGVDEGGERGGVGLRVS